MAKQTPSPVEVNAPANTVVIDYAALIVARAALSSAPIDSYYARAKELVRISGETWCNGQLLGLLTVDLVGTVELYVRSVLVGTVGLCPVAKKLAGRKHVPIAAVSYYPAPELAYAVIDHLPLSDSKAIANTTANLVGFQTNTSSSVEAALQAFDRVCHVRHAVTHQNGRLGPHNLLELGLEVLQPSAVALDAIKFQELVAACHSLVRAYNQFLFERMLERWATEGLFSFDWAKDEQIFRSLCTLLVSRDDFPVFDASDAYAKLGGVLVAAKKRATKGKLP